MSSHPLPPPPDATYITMFLFEKALTLLKWKSWKTPRLRFSLQRQKKRCLVTNQKTTGISQLSPEPFWSEAKHWKVLNSKGLIEMFWKRNRNLCELMRHSWLQTSCPVTSSCTVQTSGCKISCPKTWIILVMQLLWGHCMLLTGVDSFRVFLSLSCFQLSWEMI